MNAPRVQSQRTRTIASLLWLVLGIVVLDAPSARAQTSVIDLHADFGAGGPIAPVGNLYRVLESDGVRPAGSNDRFHVFDQFDVGTGDIVQWEGPAGTRNIFNLVTGGDRSDIDGTLRTLAPLSADVYLVNPEGILFGPNAQLDLGGSFFASTADRIEFDDGGQLDLDDADGASVAALSVADFAAFGFLDNNESINLEGASLIVADDRVLGLHAARHVRIDAAPDDTPAQLRAGRIELSSDSGDVRLRGGRVTSVRGAVAGGSGVVVDADEDLLIANGSGIESAGDLGVSVVARTIEVEDLGSEILSTADDVVGGTIVLDASRRVSIRDDARVASVATGTGDAGDIRITARDLLLLDASVETTSASTTAGQGDIDLEIDRVANLIDGRIESDVDDSAAGRIDITAPLVVVQEDSRIASRASSLDVETELLVRSEEAEIEAESISISGNEIVRNLQADLNERLEVLPQHFFEKRVRLDKSCAARSGEALGSLVIDPQRVAVDRPDHLRRAYYGTRRAKLEATTPLEVGSWNPFPRWFSQIPEPDADDWLALAQRGERMGNLSRAVEAAGQGIRRTRDAVTRAGLHAVRGRIRAQLEEHRAAEEDFAAANAFAEEADNDPLRAAVLLDRATAELRRRDFEAALPRLEAAVTLATEARAEATRLAAEANLISGLLAADAPDRAREWIENHLSRGVQTLDAEDEMESALHVALAAVRADLRQPGADRLVALAQRGLEFDQRRIVALAWAWLAGLYAEEGRLDEAIELTRWAIEASLDSHERARLASLEVQLADLLRDAGDLAGAVRSYQMALESMPMLVRGGPRRLTRGPFEAEDVEVSVATSLVDVILQAAAIAEPGEGRDALIREARDRVEAERVRELRDHFDDPCIQALEKKPADAIPNAVVVHPVVLADRLELIVSSGGGLRAYDVHVARGELLDVVDQTERALRNRTTNRYRKGAARLYEWIVRPMESELAREGVETLVFVTGGALRGFPMAALYDAEADAFLIEKIAVAATPGLTLTRPRPMVDRALVVLRAGLDTERDDQPALRKVGRELDLLTRMFSGVELRGASFVPRRMERILEGQSFDVIHIASHGVFPEGGEAPHLLTAGPPLGFEDLASMIRRTRFRDRPTELITLSACETAVGHEQAALGFAGLAIQSGARSTLATLWRVNDEASADFMGDFYGALASGDATRAEALRFAQLRFLENPVLRHPYFWAPYLLLGNWQ